MSSLFYIYPVFLVANYRMAKISHKIQIDISLIFDILIHQIIQFFECHIRTDYFHHPFMKFPLHDKAIPPIIAGYFIERFHNTTIFNNNCSRIISPYITNLRTKIYSNSVLIYSIVSFAIFCTSRYSGNIFTLLQVSLFHGISYVLTFLSGNEHMIAHSKQRFLPACLIMMLTPQFKLFLRPCVNFICKHGSHPILSKMIDY